jgi:hypothetical protein
MKCNFFPSFKEVSKGFFVIENWNRAEDKKIMVKARKETVVLLTNHYEWKNYFFHLGDLKAYVMHEESSF